jgi:hypothetical protein
MDCPEADFALGRPERFVRNWPSSGNTPAPRVTASPSENGTAPDTSLDWNKRPGQLVSAVVCPIDERFDCRFGGSAREEGQVAGTLDGEMSTPSA